jgi:carbonic anhydrase
MFERHQFSRQAGFVTLNRRSFLFRSGLNAFGLAAALPFIHPAKAEAAAQSSKESARSCRPKDPLTALIDGNARFADAWQAKNKATDLNERAQVMSNLWLDHCFLPASVLEESQSPWASIISCADSRVAPEWIFDAAAGDLFVVRSAGNTPFDEGIASLEFGVAVLKTPLILVLGHSNCGAVRAARANHSLTPLFDQLIKPIQANLIPGDTLMSAIKTNAQATAEQLTTRSAVLANAVQAGQLQIEAGYFDIASGKVFIL